MIIYNSNKKFIGIDESDLKVLGFKNLAALQAESADFADLFVKTPGHVHNFKHVHWIDFVLCAKSAQESRAIIHANDKNFKVTLEVKIIYLSDAPSTQAFSISLNNIRSLSEDEKTDIAGELQVRVAPSAAAIDITLDDFDTVSEDVASQEIVNDEVVVDDEAIDIYEPTQEELADIGEADIEDIEDKIEIPVEEYIFDPQKAAESLEMPVALIEEFIEDFISQAKEFKDAIYNSVAQDDMVELQAYSHKLKGVAANLRVDDALEILTKINKAKDFTTSQKDLDTFYKIISKLSGKNIEINKAPIEEKEPVKIDLENISINEDDELLEIVEDDDSIEIDFDDEDDDEKLIIPDDYDDIEEDDEIVISDDFDMLDDAMNEILKESDNDDDDDFTIETVSQDYNKADAASEIGIDEESFNELFDDYINESQNLISSIEEAINNDDASAWKEASIKLKGMSDNMRINSFITDLKVLITTKVANDAQNALTHIQSFMFKILETKD